MPTVLLVDDEKIVLKLFGRTLENSGLRVLAAANGREALEVFQASPESIDILVTDVVMPEMDGFSLAKRVLADCPGLPVLFISAVVLEAEIPGIRPNESCRFLRKPILPKTLVSAVEEMLGGNTDRCLRAGG